MPLPMTLLTRRLESELQELVLNRRISARNLPVDLSKFPLVLDLILHSPGPVLTSDGIEWTSDHNVEVIIGRDYPYQPPIVRWRSDIFHPNIMCPEDGGYVCMRALVHWDFSRDIGSLLDGLVAMLVNPNPRMPLGSESCRWAARLFSEKRPEFDRREFDAR